MVPLRGCDTGLISNTRKETPNAKIYHTRCGTDQDSCKGSLSNLISPHEWVKMESFAPSLIYLEIDGGLIVEDWIPSVGFEMPVLQTLSIDIKGNESSSFYGLLGCIFWVGQRGRME